MNESRKSIIGGRVKIVPQHWRRGGEIGRLIRFEQRGQNNWLVKFENSYPGGGIDGDKLWFDQREFSEATDQDDTAEAVDRIDEEENDRVSFDPL